MSNSFAPHGSFRPVESQPSQQLPAQSPTAEKFRALRAEIAKAVVGQEHAVTSVLIGLLCEGHVLLEGVPGTAKTLLVRSLAASLELDAKRVQFTPDLMPGDLTGSLIYNSADGQFTFRQGPVFTNLLIADEINRTPPKTQAALLEAMAEHQVSVDGDPRELPEPFMVVATQNPVEYEGTYPLPEAQLDRFMLKVHLPLPPGMLKSRCCAGMRATSTPTIYRRRRSTRLRGLPTCWPPAQKYLALRSTCGFWITSWILYVQLAKPLQSR